MKRSRKRYGQSKDPRAAFRAAARKVERMIADVEAGRTSSMRDELPMFEALNKLETRAYKDWRAHGDDAIRAQEEAIVSWLRARAREASNVTGPAARQRRFAAERTSIRERERDRLAAMDPAARAYEKELALLRGGR